MHKLFVGVVFTTLVTVASVQAKSELSVDASTGRWYSSEQLAEGNALFQQYCASCHGKQAQGTANWKQRDANGILPPPPLNGTGHAWHHPLSLLKQVVHDGGAPYGGTMPAWGGVLTEAQIEAVIAAIQQHWPDAVYQRWLQIQNQH